MNLASLDADMIVSQTEGDMRACELGSDGRYPLDPGEIAVSAAEAETQWRSFTAVLRLAEIYRGIQPMPAKSGDLT